MSEENRIGRGRSGERDAVHNSKRMSNDRWSIIFHFVWLGTDGSRAQLHVQNETVLLIGNGPTIIIKTKMWGLWHFETDKMYTDCSLLDKVDIITSIWTTAD